MLVNLFLEDTYGARRRSTAGCWPPSAGSAGLVVLPVHRRLLRLALPRRTRPGPSASSGLVTLPAALFTPIQFFMPNAVLFTLVGIPQAILLTAGFTMIGPLLQSIVPYRLRGLGASLGSIYVFFLGATGGGLLAVPAHQRLRAPHRGAGDAGAVDHHRRPADHPQRPFIRGDIVAGRRGAAARSATSTSAAGASPSDLPVIQVRNLDFSYGTVQVLFDVDLDVRQGEMLALLGTNGAGKSTLLRVISGLGRRRAGRRPVQRPHDHLRRRPSCGSASASCS